MRLDALENEAREVLSSVAFDYIAGGAGQGVTIRDNIEAWNRIKFRPQMLRDVSSVTTRGTLLGSSIPLPVMIAPTAMHGWVCGEKEIATARGAARAGAPYVVSMASTTSLEDIAEAAPSGRRWMQLYVPRDRGVARDVCERAYSTGYEALVVTVDSPVASSRQHIDAGNFRVPPGMKLPNMSTAEVPDIFSLVDDYDPGLTFDDLSRLKSWAGGMPLIVKGILRGDDAVRCLDGGADAVVVSNHGGRQVDHSVSTAEALVDVTEAVGERGEVYVDGGIRSGEDVLKALALGARAVLLGRPIVWALTIAGEDGVVQLLEEFRAGLTRVMALCGVPDLGTIERNLVICGSRRST